MHQHSATGRARIALKVNEILSSDLNKIYSTWAVTYSFSVIQVYSEEKFALVYVFTRNFSLIQALKWTLV